MWLFDRHELLITFLHREPVDLDRLVVACEDCNISDPNKFIKKYNINKNYSVCRLKVYIIVHYYKATIVRALIGYLLGHYSPKMPTGHYRLCKSAKQIKVHPKAAFVLFLKLILRQNTMNENEHSDSEFCYPEELESHKENSEATALSGNKQVYENSQEEIESFVKEQKSENTTRKSFSDMKTFQRYLSSVSKGNVEVLDLPLCSTSKLKSASRT